jgi:hypothetical protein
MQMRRFLIVGTQRTGSSALAEGIGSHPEVACGLEWATREPWWRRVAVIRRGLSGDFEILHERHQKHMAGVFRGDERWIGCRWLFASTARWWIHPGLAPRLWVHRLGGAVRWIARQRDLHVVHIVREDNVDWLKSCHLAAAARSYWGQAYPEDLSVEIPTGNAMAMVRSKNWIDHSLAALARSNPYLAVSYKELLKDNKATVNGALAFLGCEMLPELGLKTFRQSQRGVEEYVTNYGEVRGALEANGLLRSPCPPT